MYLVTVVLTWASPGTGDSDPNWASPRSGDSGPHLWTIMTWILSYIPGPHLDLVTVVPPGPHLDEVTVSHRDITWTW